MKPLVFTMLGVLSVLGISLPAVAQQDTQGGGNSVQGRNAEGMRQPLPRRDEQKSSDPRTSTQKTQGHERLSSEERRQLRRDINAAGRDIYRRSGP